jgi:hypothetical protein
VSPEGRLIAAGAHGAVELASAELYSAARMAHYFSTVALPGLCVDYRGHRDDLVMTGCVAAAQLREFFNEYHDDGHGGLWLVESKAGPDRRGWLSARYCLVSRAHALRLPGLQALCPDQLNALGEPSAGGRGRAAAQVIELDRSPRRRPHLRLVVDNTRAAGEELPAH